MDESGRTRSGIGPSNVGVKWRFYDSGDTGRSISIYPQLEFASPGSSVERGLVEGDTTLFLPVEFVQPLGPVSMNLEVGYLVSDPGDELVLGVALGRELGDRLELLAEVWGFEPVSGGEGLWVANLGVRYGLREGLTLLMAGGRGVAGARDEAAGLGFLGLQLTFSDADAQTKGQVRDVMLTTALDRSRPRDSRTAGNPSAPTIREAGVCSLTRIVRSPASGRWASTDLCRRCRQDFCWLGGLWGLSQEYL